MEIWKGDIVVFEIWKVCLESLRHNSASKDILSSSASKYEILCVIETR